MTNLYLEKIAGKQEHVGAILKDHYERITEIERPIQDMHDDMDQLEDAYYADGTTERPYNHHRAYLIDSIRSNRESQLRRDLGTEDKHTENRINTAKKLLADENLAQLVTKENAHDVIKNFTRIPHESNGWIGLKSLGTVGSTIAGGALGFAAGAKAGGPIALATTAAGALSGGMLGHYGLKNLLGNKIDSRKEEIYDNRESNIDKAYEKLRRTMTPV